MIDENYEVKLNTNTRNTWNHLKEFYSSADLELLLANVGLACEFEIELVRESLMQKLSVEEADKLRFSRAEQIISSVYDVSVEAQKVNVGGLLQYKPLSRLMVAKTVHEAYFGRMKE